MRKGKQERQEQDHLRPSDQALTINPINNGKQQQKQPPCSAQQNTLSSEVPQTPRNRQKSKVYVSKTPKPEVGSSYSNTQTEKKIEKVEEKGKSSDGFASELMNSTINPKEELHEEVKGVGDVSRLLEELSLVGEGVELSEEELNINDQLQEYEIMAMEAIYGDNVTILRKEGSRRSFQIHIPFETPDEFTISAKLCVSNENDVKLEEKPTSTTATDDPSNEFSYTFEVQHLPPIVLTCLLTKSYPSHQPPYFIISSQWLDSLRISKLCRMLDSLWEDQPNQEVIHQWVEWLHSSSLSYLGIDKDMILGPYNLSDTGDKRAVSGSVSPEIDIPLLMKYNGEKCHEVFRENLHECRICFSEYTGTEFIRLPCKHFFCRKCMETYSSIHVKERTVHQLLCPDCRGMVPPYILKLLLGNEEFEQWESLLLQKTLGSMSDIIYCPRCESVCLEDGDHDAQCPECFFSFCSICGMRRHPGISCVPPGVTLEILMERQGSSQLSQDQKRRELDRINEIISINMILLDSRQCPSCKTAVFRSAGCNKIICKCGKFFCYQCGESITDNGHFRRGCRLFPREAFYTGEVQERKLVTEIEIEHLCPICSQMNVKDTSDNHILCQTCHNHYCYLCHSSVHDSFRHFGPNGCQRFTVA